MTVRDAWKGSPAFRWVMGVIASALVMGIAGGVVMYAQLTANTAILQDMRTDIRQVHRDFNERLLYIERDRRSPLDGGP